MLGNLSLSPLIKSSFLQRADDYGAALSNAIFHCSANCSFVDAAIRLHSKSFSSEDWASGGSKLFTKALKEICEVN